MGFGERGKQVCRYGAIALVFGAAPGCISYLHPAAPPNAELSGPCRSVPKCSRDHVYVFLVHGMDPFNFANLSGLRDYVQRLGFNKTYYGQLYHTWSFDKEIHKIHEEDPEAHFVLIGFSFGANMVRNLAQSAKESGIKIDLLVYLGGNTLDDTPEDKPDNVKQIVNILASGCIWNGALMEGAINMHETDVWHFGSPTHPQTLEVLAKELAKVADAIPIHPEDPSVLPVPYEEPTPRPEMNHVSAKFSDSDVLRPITRMRMPGVPRRPTDYEQTRVVKAPTPLPDLEPPEPESPRLSSPNKFLPDLEASGLALPRSR
jgi:hypothetical protein